MSLMPDSPLALLKIEALEMIQNYRLVKERELHAWVVDYAVATGWLTYSVPDSRRTPRGFPDLVLIREDRALFIELKTETGRVRVEQEIWLGRMEACGLTTRVWRPSDLKEIMDTLA